MAVPQGGIQEEIEFEEEPSRTYKIDFVSKRIVGMTDGLDAIKQAVYKILQTERFEHLIYSENYGVELRGLVGSNPLFVQSELSRRIQEALLQDDRITSVEGFRFDFEGDRVLVTFTVDTQYGDFRSSLGVSINV